MSVCLIILSFFHLLLIHDEKKNLYAAIKSNQSDSLVISRYTDLMKSFGPNKIDSVKKYGAEALKFAHLHQYWKGEINVNYNLSNILSVHGQLTESISYAEKAVGIARKHNDTASLARTFGLMTIIYGRKGDFTTSTKYVFKSLKLYEKLNDIKGVLTSYIKLSAISVQTHKYDEVLLYTHKADSLNKLVKDKDYSVDIANNRAIAYAEQGKLDEALKTFQYIYDLASKEGSPDISQKALALMNMGLVYKEKKQYPTAIKYYKRSFQESIDNNFPEGILKNLQNISQAYYLMGEYEKSNREGLIALKKSKEMRAADLEIEILELLKENYTLQGDYKNALKFTDEFHKAKEKLNFASRDLEIERIKEGYELSKANEKIKLINEASQTKTNQRNLSIVLLVIAVLSLFTFAYAYYRIRKLNRQLLINKNKLAESNNIKDKLFSILGHDLRGSYASTINVLTLIKSETLEPGELRMFSAKALQQAKHSLSTLDELLAWGNAQIKGSTLNITAFDCFPSIEKNIDFLSESIHIKQIQVENNVQENTVLEADQDHFNFIVRNLISNAIKFTSKEGIIRIGCHLLENDFYQFHISDSGIGMTKERLDELFSKELYSSSGTGNEKGTGLGLLLCKEFVELNGGKIFAESEEGKGSTFYFTLKKGN